MWKIKETSSNFILLVDTVDTPVDTVNTVDTVSIFRILYFRHPSNVKIY